MLIIGRVARVLVNVYRPSMIAMQSIFAWFAHRDYLQVMA